jgi:protein-S-isoprenylcysteine O-methyltransferase Ste14
MASLIAITALWVAWVLSWIVAARWADPAAKRPAPGESALYRLATVGGAAALFVGDRFDGAPLWRLNAGAAWTLVAVAALGLAFTWWARLYLGRLWSSAVTRKADHHVVDTGPYAIVRHPIYTGIIVALYATAFLKASALGIAGVVVMTYGFWLKARLEERFLSEQLGAEAYDAYRRKVPMLIPFGRAGRAA